MNYDPDSYQPLLMSHDEAATVKAYLSDQRENEQQHSLLVRSITARTKALTEYMANPIEVPGHGEAGGYEHHRHKQNYIFLHSAGLLFLITGKPQYRDYAAEMLTQYAKVYPSLTLNTSRDSNPPGRLFHQTLNESMWLLYAADAYSCIQQTLTEEQKQLIENSLLREMASLFTETYQHDFDIVHNHGLWFVAAVGLCGYAVNDQSIVDKAIYGLKGDSTSGGFLAQLSQLFSADGYYMEGPYYHRFAIRPLLLFAEAIARRQPQLNIYNYNEQIIRRTSFALMATAFPNGTLPALNDASRSMNIRDEGVLIATSICYSRYSQDPKLIEMANQQNAVWISAAGLELAKAASAQPSHATTWDSVLLRDGPAGDRGGIGILRQSDRHRDTHMALLWFGQHGSDHTLHSALDHGHFDGLHLSWFNRGQEVLYDYGFGRWVNIEPKFGGRYIRENSSYCKQTIAHNTVVVDEKSQHDGSTAAAERNWGTPHFFITDNAAGQGMSAYAGGYYDGVDMQRTVLLLSLQECECPVLLDLFRLTSADEHRYDYPIHYHGQIIQTDFSYQTHKHLAPLGQANGYQHLWEVARSDTAATPGSASLSWLMGQSYYSVTIAVPRGGEIIMTRTGANDPDFNLRSEPAVIVRTKGANQLFATAYETHGYFDEATESSTDARGSISRVEVIGHDQTASVVRLHTTASNCYTVMISNQPQPDTSAQHTVTFSGKTYTWQNMFSVEKTH
ncbi:alginate lyase family protein [Exilibacterium tricleocarpae]|uniref:Alginate lyase family protein n=1 Tax=Exilibacterium tricleocarpae TaxID=2591008 RepID=A0A545SQX0_9GAMM|nr:heparinase II/III family protein [Exilibacterium tricleocarpae]TQV67286.1 alginate lyase family protein [Exilibacterium tricleocarpae]